MHACVCVCVHVFTAHGSVGAPASASPPPHPALLRDEQMDTVGEGVGGGGGGGVWRATEKQKRAGRSSLSGLLLATVTQDAAARTCQTNRGGKGVVHKAFGRRREEAWKTKVTRCRRVRRDGCTGGTDVICKLLAAGIRRKTNR